MTALAQRSPGHLHALWLFLHLWLFPTPVLSRVVCPLLCISFLFVLPLLPFLLCGHVLYRLMHSLLQCLVLLPLLHFLLYTSLQSMLVQLPALALQAAPSTAHGGPRFADGESLQYLATGFHAACHHRFACTMPQGVAVPRHHLPHVGWGHSGHQGVAIEACTQGVGEQM